MLSQAARDYGGALNAGLIRLHARSHARARAPTPTDPHTNVRAHTHTHKYILIAFPWQQWFRERASALRYMYKVVQI